MNRKGFFSAVFFSIILLVSCSNGLSGTGVRTGKNNISFVLGEPFSIALGRTVLENENVPENPDLEIIVNLLQGQSLIVSNKKVVPLKNLSNTEFNLTSIPYGMDYHVTIDVFYNNILIYKVASKKFSINDSNSEIDLKLSPVQCNSKISFVLNDGKFQPDIKVPGDYFIDSEIELPTPVRELYNFDGWYLDEECKGARITHVGKNLFLGDVTLYALWTGKDNIRPVIISPSDSSLIDFGDKISLDCETEGVSIYYTTDDSIPNESSKLYNDVNKITVDDSVLQGDSIKIKAIAVKNRMMPSAVATRDYTLKRYTVSFDKGLYGIESVKDIPDKKKGEIIDLPQLTEPDFTLDGWLDNGTRFTDTYEVSKNITLTADWREVNGVSKVTFTPSQSLDSAGSIDYRETVTLECSTPGSEIFYTTDNSSAKTSSTRKKYNSGNPIVIDKDMTIKAVAEKSGRTTSQEQSVNYKVRKYTVTFDRNGHGSAPSQATGLKKGDIVSEPGTLSDTGYIFGEWYKESSCKNQWDFNTDKIDTSNITLYAKWTPITYTVRFDGNGSNSGSTTQQTLTYDKQEILNTNGFSRTGYIFNGWNTKQNGSGTKYTDRQSKTFNLLNTNDGTITLYAQWTPITYTVNFNLNGGSGSVSSMTCTYDKPFNMPSYDNNKSGFSSLNAWTVNNDGSGASYNAGSTCSTNLCDTDKSSITLYAKWNDDAPGPVTNLKAYRADGGMTVEWTKPNVGDFKHVLVTCGGQSKEINGTSASFTGLDNATAYTITAKVYDKGNNVSTEQSVSKNKMVSLAGYQTPQISGKKVTFGVWPQTEKVPSVNFDGTNTAKINGWNCRFGDDGQYYVEVKKLSDSYYFKVEPIVWKVISEGSGKKLIVSEKVITASKFGEGSCTYKDSTLRNYLNNEFKTKAFSTSGESRIANTNLGNGVTADKIFPLCKSDYTTGSYGFSSDADRIAYMTPYSYEIGVTNMNSQAQFWTRTEENTPNASTNSYYVDVKGRLQLSVNTSVEGVQPAMWITN